MVVRVGVRDAEAERYPVEKGRVRDVPSREVRADGEDELVDARSERLAFEQRRVRATIGVGAGGRKGDGFFFLYWVQRDLHARRGAPAGGVEDVGR